ncbi:MAG: hypothetical protein AAF628_27125 [Planctomycetota bacterium]
MLSSATLAQSAAAAEAALAEHAASRLASHATAWSRAGLRARARRLWLEAVTEYDVDHAASRAGLGHVRLGSTWAPRSTESLAADTGSAARAKALQRQWRKVAAGLAAKHAGVAVAWAEEAELEPAARHWRRTLRFDPRHAAAGEALGWARIDDVFVSPAEAELLDRARRLRQVAAWLRRHPIAVESLPADATHPKLEIAAVPYRGVRSANYTVWGDLPSTQLAEVAAQCERALAFTRVAFAGDDELNGGPVRLRQLAFFGAETPWRRVVEANREELSDEAYRYTMEHGESVYLAGGSAVLYMAWDEDPARIGEDAARVVALDAAQLHAHALRAGVGRVLVQLLLQRSTLFLVGDAEAEPPRTSAESGARTVVDGSLPVTAGELARSSVALAWAADADADQGWAELVLRTAARLRVADRLAAWSLCDYLLRSAPGRLRALDRARAAVDRPADVAATFADDDGAELVELAAEWRQFWREDRLWPLATGELTTRPSEGRVRAWVAACNERRWELGLDPVGWRVDDAVAQAAGALALTGRGGVSAAAVAAWTQAPASRHVLLDPHLAMLAVSARGAITLAPRSRSAGVTAEQTFPPDGATVPRDVVLSLHFYGDAAVDDIACAVSTASADVEGALELPVSGCATFAPSQPLPADTDVEIRWTWTEDGAPRRRAVTLHTASR